LCGSEDFNQSLKVSKIINDYITTNTAGLIEDIIEPNMINALIAAILVNTIYFKCMWAKPFDKMFTEPRTKFKSDLSGSTHLVPMMNTTQVLPYYATFDYHMIEIPYKRNEFVMGIVLNKSKESTPFSKSNHNVWNSALQDLNICVQNLRLTNVKLSLPKFTQRKNVSLIPEFKKHGVNALFDQQRANLSDIADSIHYL